MTNKELAHARRLLQCHDLLHHFELVIGGDSLPQKKPHASVLQHVACTLGVAPMAMAHVGDSAIDVQAARQAGVRAWACRMATTPAGPLPTSIPTCCCPIWPPCPGRAGRRHPGLAMIQALLWDVDGTLAETERDGHRPAFNQAFAALGLDWHWDELRYGELLRITGGRERLLADMATRSDAPPAVERERLAQQLHRLKNRFYAERVAAGHIALRPGVRELVDEAGARGLRQAIVTTTSRSNVHALLLRHFGPQWQQRFPVQVCGEDVAAKKPDPEAHRRALQALGLGALGHAGHRGFIGRRPCRPRRRRAGGGDTQRLFRQRAGGGRHRGRPRPALP